MKKEALGHHKMINLARALEDASKAIGRQRTGMLLARGLMESLWNWTAAQCPRGDIGKYADKDICSAVQWPENVMQPAELIQILIEKRWIDTCEKHRLIVHDWHEHCPDSVHMKLARAKDTFANGATPSRSKLSKEERNKAEQESRTGKKTEVDGKCAHGERTDNDGERTETARERTTSTSTSTSTSTHTHTTGEGGGGGCDGHDQKTVEKYGPALEALRATGKMPTLTLEVVAAISRMYPMILTEYRTMAIELSADSEEWFRNPYSKLFAMCRRLASDFHKKNGADDQRPTRGCVPSVDAEA